MNNPWLEIKAEDYEGHMGNPDVDQLEPLRKIFSTALKDFCPKRIALLGCSTGNGLEEIDYKKIKKVYALDINNEYLEILKKRHYKNLTKIETIVCDLNSPKFCLEKIDLVYAALIFEYVDVKKVLKNILKWMREGGMLIAVLQLPCKDIPEVTPSPFKSLEKLSSIMKLVKPEDFISAAESNSFCLISSKIHFLKSGKQFWEGRFEKAKE